MNVFLNSFVSNRSVCCLCNKLSSHL